MWVSAKSGINAAEEYCIIYKQISASVRAKRKYTFGNPNTIVILYPKTAL